MLWQRTTKSTEVGAGFPLQRACDVDCTVPCSLVAAGIFGAIDVATGATVFNVSAAAGSRIGMVDGIAYSVTYSVTGPGQSSGILVASPCAADGNAGGNVERDATVAASPLWSAPLPAGPGGVWDRAVVVTPASPYLSVRAASVSATGSAQAGMVVVGGHSSGACSRGHCSPSYSAIAAFQVPPGITPPPVPPPPPAPGPAPGPSTCETKMMSACAAARSQSASLCEVTLGDFECLLLLLSAYCGWGLVGVPPLFPLFLSDCEV